MPGDAARAILWDIRLPRTLGAWLAGALLGLAGAVAQGLFRNPLADPYLLGSATGAAFGVARAAGCWPASRRPPRRLGRAPGADRRRLRRRGGWRCCVTLALARGVQHTLRLLLAGVIVGMVFGAFAALVMFWAPEICAPCRPSCSAPPASSAGPASALLAARARGHAAGGAGFSRALDALALGETTAASLGVALAPVRVVLVGRDGAGHRRGGGAGRA